MTKLQMLSDLHDIAASPAVASLEDFFREAAHRGFHMDCIKTVATREFGWVNPLDDKKKPAVKVPPTKPRDVMPSMKEWMAKHKK